MRSTIIFRFFRYFYHQKRICIVPPKKNIYHQKNVSTVCLPPKTKKCHHLSLLKFWVIPTCRVEPLIKATLKVSSFSEKDLRSLVWWWGISCFARHNIWFIYVIHHLNSKISKHIYENHLHIQLYTIVQVSIPKIPQRSFIEPHQLPDAIVQLVQRAINLTAEFLDVLSCL